MDNYNAADFAAYLSRNTDDMFILDLSNATLIECIHEMIKVKNKTSPKYGKKYSCLLNNLKKLQEDMHVLLKPIHITDIFWNYFIAYLRNNGIAISSIKTLASQLKTAVGWAAKHKAEVSDSFLDVRLPSYCHQQIALTQDDVSHIYHFDLNTIPRRPNYLKHLERVKDMFVLSCNLGQRFSDMIRIDRTCFDRNIFSILQQKTGCHARVDIERMALDRNTVYKILEKYNYNAPLTTDISCFDRYIKELTKYIGFTEMIKRETKVNGHIEVKFYPKYKLIGSHTARRTFATINILRGFPGAEVRRATGHKSESAFEKYLCYYD